MVYLKLQSHKQHSMHIAAFHKLSARYYGSFEVMAKVGIVAYKLKLPASANIHNVFHVSLLKKKVGNHVIVDPQLPNLTDYGKKAWYPAAVLEVRIVKKKGVATPQWLIQWYHATPEEATWEDARDIVKRYPNFDSDATT